MQKNRGWSVDRESPSLPLCEKWKQPRSSEQITSVRASVRKEVNPGRDSFDGFLVSDWRALVHRVMAAYDTRVMGGELAKILFQQGISVVVQLTDDDQQEEKEHAYSIKFDPQVTQRFADDQTGWVLNGIICHDVIDLVQVSIEGHLARLIADTVCRQSEGDAAAGQTRCREFARSLFGHTFRAAYSRLEQLPADVLGKISALLPTREAVTLGQSNKQTRDTLSGPRAGIKVSDYVSVTTVLDPARGWSRRKGVIGHFSAFIVTSLEELAHLPREARQLWLGLPSDTVVTSDMLPGFIKQLDFSASFDQPIEGLKLPASLTHLTFGFYFNQPIKGLKLPASLTHLTFGHGFDKPIDGLKLPASLTHLTFGSKFDHPIEGLELPASLTHLTFGSYFDQPIEGLKLPASLTHLTFGNYFDHQIEGLKLPASLTRLTLSQWYVSHRWTPLTITKSF